MIRNIKNKSGARRHRRRLYDAALGQYKPLWDYKADKFGSDLVLAGRYFPSSQRHHGCASSNVCWLLYRYRQSDTVLYCSIDGSPVDRDDNAAGNLRDFPDMEVGAQAPFV